MIEKINSYFSARKDLCDFVGQVIGYSDIEDHFIDARDKYWTEESLELVIDDDNLCQGSRLDLINEVGRGYTISSMGNKGTKHYMGQSGDIWFIMAYDEYNDDWSDSVVFILDNGKKL